jgi:hypothetical protein
MTQYLFYFLPCILAFTLFWNLWRRDYLEDCDKLTSKLTPGIIEDLSLYLTEDDWNDSDAEFWAVSGGVTGLFKRLITTSQLVRLCKVALLNGGVETADLAPVMQCALLQALFTFIALPEVVWCRYLGIPHICARLSANFLASTYSRTSTLLLVAGSPACLRRLQSL